MRSDNERNGRNNGPVAVLILFWTELSREVISSSSAWYDAVDGDVIVDVSNRRPNSRNIWGYIDYIIPYKCHWGTLCECWNNSCFKRHIWEFLRAHRWKLWKFVFHGQLFIFACFDASLTSGRVRNNELSEWIIRLNLNWERCKNGQGNTRWAVPFYGRYIHNNLFHIVGFVSRSLFVKVRPVMTAIEKPPDTYF